MAQIQEATRLTEAYAEGTDKDWLHWGPYLSERQWGTVREDYSPGGNAWDYFSHDQARSRTYRWGEDGLAGFSDPEQRLCFALALWNHKDPILKERLFGLTNSEGNHGEDVKEYYYYLDNTPTHSYMKWLYKYPQAAYPYANLVEENGRRKSDPHSMEYELINTGVFNEDRYFDVVVEYAKSSSQDTLIKISIKNNGPDTAPITVLPTLWFRNTWRWFPGTTPPDLTGSKGGAGQSFDTILATPAPGDDGHPMALYCKTAQDLYFTNNETNNQLLFGSSNVTTYVKDGINDHVLKGASTINPGLTGTKASAFYSLSVAPGATEEVLLRLSSDTSLGDPFGTDFGQVFSARLTEADQFYAAIGPNTLTEEQQMIQRQAYAGMLWSKQFYNYVVADWLDGDPAGPPPPAGRNRNASWRHLYASNILSMPDAWEYPWFAAWDLCFQTVVFARLDLQFAKQQLLFLAREWYMDPDGAIPAYEWAFSDINPPLHAWAALHLFNLEKESTGDTGDLAFLKEIFDCCLMNFTWWANRESSDGADLFEGGFLGLDNISIINRSNLQDFENQIGKSVTLKQSDGTSWMGMFSLKMMEIALVLSEEEGEGYIHFVSKFLQHFVFIADAMNNESHGTQGAVRMWDEADGFYYDFLEVNGDTRELYSLKFRSLVGVIALFPVASLDLSKLSQKHTDYLSDRLDWFKKQHPELIEQVKTSKDGNDKVLLLSFTDVDRLTRILEHVLDENKFLSPYGIRGISKEYEHTPYSIDIDGVQLSIQYAPAESTDGSFGGNSNWRGPVWFPINFLLIETLLQYHGFLGDDFKVDYPSNSGNKQTLKEIADDLGRRMTAIFELDGNDNRPVYGGEQTFQKNPTWSNLLLFYEYFHGDNGAGLGASHQTGWTGLVAELLQRRT